MGVLQLPLPDITTISASTLTTQFTLALLHLCRLFPYSPIWVILLQGKEGDGLKIYPVLMETLWESSEEEHHLSPPLPLSVLIISSHSNRDASMQTKEVLHFSLALRQLQEATQAKTQLNWRLALKLEGLAKNYKDQQFRMVQEHKDQQTRMAEQMDTTFREVLSQMSHANLVRLLPWFLSANAKFHAGSTCSVSEAFTAITTSELEGSTATASMSSPACRVRTLPQVPLTSDILAAGTPAGQPFFALALSLKHKKWDHSPGSTPEGQSSKRTCTGTKEVSISSGHSTLPIQLVASHSPKQLELELINLPSSPVKAAANPDDRLAPETSGNTIDCDKHFVVEVSEHDADHSGDESDLSSDLQESAADSGPKSATGDCLTCSDTKEAAVNSAHKKFCKKVWASCNITQGCLWLEAQLKWICDSHQAVWESNNEVIKREWEFALKKDHHPFEVNKMMDRTNQLL